MKPNIKPPLGWKKVSFAADCLRKDPSDEIGEVCSLCGGEYVVCPCPGPTQDGFEYQEFDGELFARKATSK